MGNVDNILKLAKERGIKQSFIENLINGHRGKVTDWKLGRSTPTTEEIDIIAKYFNVSTDYLLTGNENNLKNKKENEEMGKEPRQEIIESGLKKLFEQCKMMMRIKSDLELCGYLSKNYNASVGKWKAMMSFKAYPTYNEIEPLVKKFASNFPECQALLQELFDCNIFDEAENAESDKLDKMMDKLNERFDKIEAINKEQSERISKIESQLSKEASSPHDQDAQ